MVLFGRLVCLVAVLLVTACKGGTGDTCEGPSECVDDHRCELGQCVPDTDTCCAYLRRCLRRPDVRTMVRPLLGPKLLDSLESYPDERFCRRRLMLLQSSGRGDAVVQACGVRVKKQ
jgi:hypothetical protein